jgi:hypothetical protein
VRLAKEFTPEAAVHTRLAELAELEAGIIADCQGPMRMHS